MEEVQGEAAGTTATASLFGAAGDSTVAPPLHRGAGGGGELLLRVEEEKELAVPQLECLSTIPLTLLLLLLLPLLLSLLEQLQLPLELLALLSDPTLLLLTPDTALRGNGLSPSPLLLLLPPLEPLPLLLLLRSVTLGLPAKRRGG